MEQKDSFLNFFFHSFSKMILLIPVIILGLGLFIKFSSIEQPKKTIINPLINPIDVSKQTFNLDSSMICQYLSKEVTIKAYIKNKRVYAEKVDKSTTNYYLLTGDCLYSWQKKKQTGGKMCGFSDNLNSVIPILSQAKEIESISSRSEEIKELIKSCEKQEIKDEKIFEIPKNVIFNNK